MSSLERSRKDIERGIESNEKITAEGQEKLDRDVQDKDIIKELAVNLKGNGTLEGFDRIFKRGEQAGEKVDTQAEKDHKELDDKAHLEASDREGQLREKGEDTKMDANEIDKDSSKVEQKEAASNLKEAAREARDDEKYLKQKENSQRGIREGSERKADKKVTEVKNNRPNFR